MLLHNVLFAHYFYAMEITKYSCVRSRPPVKEMINNVAMINNASLFDRLNKDIGDNIIRKLFDVSFAKILYVDEISINISIKNAIKYYLTIKEHCPLKVGNKIYDLEDLLFLPHQTRQQLISIGNPSRVKKISGYSHDVLSSSDSQLLEKMPDYIRKDLKTTVFYPDPKVMFSCDEEDAGICFTTSGCFCLGAGIICCDDKLDIFLRLLGICPICSAVGLLGCYIGMKNNCSYRECFDRNYKEKQY